MSQKNYKPSIQQAREITCVLCGSLFTLHTHLQGDYGLCPCCFSRDNLREWDRLMSAKGKLQPEVPNTLSLIEWLNSIASWHGLCALCETVGYSHMDMLRQEDGLTANNVIPTCRACHVHSVGSWAEAMTRVAEVMSGNNSMKRKANSSHAALQDE